MKAMVLSRIAPIDEAPLELRDAPIPSPGRGEVLVRVLCCGVCRTDLHVIEGDLPRQTLPLIPGHQVVGEVTECGADCERFTPGDRVGIAWLRHTCGECVYCRNGQENLCESSRFTGYHVNGGYAEYAIVPEAFAYAIPEGFDPIDAAPLLCAGIIGYRALKRCNLPDGGAIALYGFGSSAHVVFQLAMHRGCRVFVVTRGESHRQLARDMGAEWVAETPEGMPEKVDSAIIFAPAGELVPPALRALRKGGTLALAGIYMSDIPQMSYEDCVFYERDIHSVTANTREDGEGLLAEAAAVPVTPHVTIYSLEDANQALQDLKADKIDGSAVIAIAKGNPRA